MKQIKIAAGLAHVDYGRMADIVTEATDAGVDIIHCDAADMTDLKNMQLMGGHQVISGIRPHTTLPIECHAYVREADVFFVDQIAKSGANSLILPAEQYLGADGAYILRRCRDHGISFGFTIGCFAPLSFVEEAVYELDRLHIVVHGVNNDDWTWRETAIPLIRNARALIEKRNPRCELAVDGGIRASNLAKLVNEDIDVLVASSAIFKHEEGIRAGVLELKEAIDRAILS